MTTLRAKNIAIIGAGPSGIAAAKYFRAEKAFDKICVFEQRSSVGGIWNYTPDDRDEDIFTVPQTDPTGKNQDPVWRYASEHSNRAIKQGTDETPDPSKIASFLSPVYEKLETNIPRGLMGFQGLSWPEDSQLFPKHETVLAYISEYSKDVHDLISYETQVINITPTDNSYLGKWKVCTHNLRQPPNQCDQEVFDAVIVASGHFIVPYIPSIPGISAWHKAFPNSITHSKYFRQPSEFSNKKVIVVGNSASGVDLSSQIAEVCQEPLLWSSKSVSMFQSSTSTRKQECTPIARFHVNSKRIEFEDGFVAKDVDAIVFATGYFYSLPFLQDVKPPLIGDGARVQHTYKHLLYAPRPTLAFLTLPQRIIPFPIAEAQSAVLARLYSGRLCLPSKTEMEAWEPKVIKEMGAGGDFHLLPFPRDGEYINELGRWADMAERMEGLENGGKGKCGPVWGKWEFWCRGKFPEIKRAFGELGEGRCRVRTWEELGFKFEDDEMGEQNGEELI
ncbi:hypothetical protein BCR34DRAFT_500136 [Clohesyomyces aquaticus]|uniref:FAD/NAD(P)-binding domain-containing protein n=1 Tax=Clohesyomyces aquaticus TaxID=1231657 RepID=A0A1Y1Y554_9PLEO|nr:hypothetical protein BCR34DRAFT_500136 [Clohesyomyces aquaticus]